MRRRSAATDLLWGSATVTIATVVLAVASVVGGEKRPWAAIIGSAAFIIVHTIVNHYRDRSIARSLGRDYDRVQRRAVQIVSDLGQDSQFELWMVDVYVPIWKWSLHTSRPFLSRSRELARQLSVSLVDVRPQPPFVDPETGPHGRCFVTEQPVLWFDERFAPDDPNNAWTQFSDDVNTGLQRAYGALSVSPLVDQLGKDCRGVLAIHVEPTEQAALAALGILRSAKGRNAIHNACVELNGLLAT